MRTTKPFLALALASTLALAACGGDEADPADTPAPAEDTSEEMTSEEMTSEEMTEEETTEEMTSEEMTEEETTEEMTSEDEMEETSEGAMGDPAANLVGAGCADYAAAVPDGAGSVEGMAQDPVAVAASNNPLLTQLVAAVSGEINENVNLVDTLNGDEFTVFAPVDDAFGALDAETLEALGSDDGTLLSTVLTYHVVPGQLTPEEVVGTQTTVQGGTVEVTGEGDTLMVNDANVICGGVQTENATVYLIDAVLMPEM